MIYKSIELYEYKRLSLNNIKLLKIEFNERLQIILGTNGCGKSSLIRELTPLPSIKSDFNSNGYKKIIIVKNKIEYILESNFSNNNIHSFLKDKLELNQSGTISIQRELVKQEFGITNDIHELLIGLNHFTLMSPNERRVWFTRFSDTSYDYAIKKYQEIKDKQRDCVGAIKHLHNRLAQENINTINKEDEDKLKLEIIELKELLNIFLDKKLPINISIDNLKLHNERIDQNLNILTNQIKTIMKRNNYIHLNNDLDKDILEYKNKYIGIKSNILQLSKIIEEKQNLLNSFINNNISNIDGLNNKYNTNIIEINNLLDKTKFKLNLHDINIDNFYLQFNTCKDELINILSNLPINIDRKYNRDKYNLAIKDLELNKKELDNINKTQFRLIAEKEHLDKHKTENLTICPKCQHSWIKNYDANIYNNILIHIENNSNKIKELNEKIDILNKYIEDCTLCIRLYEQYKFIKNNYNYLLPLWEIFHNEEVITHNSNKGINIINEIILDTDLYYNINKLLEENDRLIKLKDDLYEKDKYNNTNLKEEIDKLENEVHNLNNDLNYINREIDKLNSYKSYIESLLEKKKELEILLDNKDKTNKQIIDTFRLEGINSSINYIKLELSSREHKLSEINIQKVLLESLNNQIVELEDQNTVLKIVMKELSPIDGLIAKGLLGFINVFTEEMNDFIRKVWTYPLEIKAALPDLNNDIDLDYKFPVSINDNNEISDVKLGSSSMKEIIDLAFIFVGMKYLHLNDYPLYLDEFGKTMDSGHRQSAYVAINNIIYNSNISQIFLVSHFEDCYASMKNSDIIILSEDNIKIPDNALVNKHVIIE